VVVVVGQSVAGRRPMDQVLDHKMVDKELVHRLAMDFLVHSFEAVAYSPSEAVAYFEAVAYSAYFEAVVYFPCEVVVDRPSAEGVGRSVEVVDHNYRMIEILPKGWMEVELDLSSMACQSPDIQQAQIEDNEASLDESLNGY
jgi:hypothetical protein